MRKACGTRFPAGREAAARPEPVPGLGMHRASPGCRKEAPQGPPRLSSPPGAPRPAGPAAPSRAVGTDCRPLGQGGREGKKERPGSQTPRQGRGRLGEAGSELPVPAPQPFFYPARNHLVYRKYLFALLVGTGVNYSTCERGVIWIKAAPVFIVWVSCLSGA